MSARPDALPLVKVQAAADGQNAVPYYLNLAHVVWARVDHADAGTSITLRLLTEERLTVTGEAAEVLEWQLRRHAGGATAGPRDAPRRDDEE
ncbi:MAG TPA: hypothetical protein VFW96_29185 [Thermomicrobiales bacterium]|nr:hypothetical protein [Thermomicrobiales bacterium]